MDPFAPQDGNPGIVILEPELFDQNIVCPVPVGVIRERARTDFLTVQEERCTGRGALEKDAVITLAGRRLCWFCCCSRPGGFCCRRGGTGGTVDVERILWYPQSSEPSWRCIYRYLIITYFFTGEIKSGYYLCGTFTCNLTGKRWFAGIAGLKFAFIQPYYRCCIQISTCNLMVIITSHFDRWTRGDTGNFRESMKRRL